jgi:hypothetical protein
MEDSDDEMEVSDDEFPIFAERRAKKLVEKKARLEDSDDDNTPLFGTNGLAEKIRQQEEEQESQQPLAPEDFLKQEVGGFSHEDLNAEAVDQAEVRLGVAESLASTPTRNEYEVSRSFQDDDEIARKAARKMTRFAGKGTLKVKK